MNPELQRNLWMELTPRRMLLMAGLLALAFFAAALPGTDYGPASLARWLFIVIVILWGTRNASLSVLGEIRDRTWDAQRLSSLDAGSMTWGKLFGSTVYNWFGGAICLAVLLSHSVVQQGPLLALVDAFYLIAMGILAHAAALLASLVGIRRRRSYGRLDISIYQAVGIGAALAFAYIWDRSAIIAAFSSSNTPEAVLWWRMAIPDRLFLLASLAIFAGWTLVGCYRLMRLELKMENGPLVWLGFLLFMGVYAAGFDAWLDNQFSSIGGDHGSLIDGEGPVRLGLAVLVFIILTYVMVFLEPKDQVHYRWLAGQVGQGKFSKFAHGLHGWMMSYGAALLTGLALILWLSHTLSASLLVVSVLGFMTRDIGIVLLLSQRGGRKRGDFGALALLAALYVAAPRIVGVMGAAYLFVPYPQAPLMSAVAAWAEAAAVIFLFTTRLAKLKSA